MKVSLDENNNIKCAIFERGKKYIEYNFKKNIENGNWEFDQGTYRDLVSNIKCTFYPFIDNNETNYYWEFAFNSYNNFYITSRNGSNDNEILIDNFIETTRIGLHREEIKHVYEKIMYYYVEYKKVPIKDTFHKQLAEIQLINALKSGNITRNQMIRKINSNNIEITTYHEKLMTDDIANYNYKHDFIEKVLSECTSVINDIENNEIKENVDLIKIMKKTY